MTVTHIDDPGQPRRGPRPKGGGGRLRIQVKMPGELAAALTGLAGQVEEPVTDLGAYYLIRGWNAVCLEQGLTPYPMPDYLEKAARQLAAREWQDMLPEQLDEESRLAG